MHFNTIINKHKKGQPLHFVEETISILDMAPDGNWATAGFDVLIVCACFFNTKETEAYWWNKSVRDREDETGNGDHGVKATRN